LILAIGLLSLVAAAPALAASADVAISAAAPSQISADTNLTYQLVTTNNGPADATAATTSDTLPTGTSLVSFVQNSGPPTGGTLPVGQSQTFTLIVHVNPGTARGTKLTNTAQVSTSASDPNMANNSAPSISWVTVPVDVAVASTAPSSVSAGGTVTYGLSVQNSGPNSAEAVTLNDPVPVGTTFVSFSQTSGPAFTCTTPAAGNSGTVRCYTENLASGSGASFSLVTQSQANAPDGSTIANLATVVADPTQNLDTSADNDATAVFTTVSNPPSTPPAPPPTTTTTTTTITTTTPTPPRDRTPPRLTVRGLPRTIKLKVLRSKGLTFTESANEAASFGNLLLGSIRTATLARMGAFNLTLAQSSLSLGTGVRRVHLTPSRKLLGKSKRFSVQVVVTGTDASGNRATVTKLVRVH
jgi:uncharacterized repeat protein (TIGR01451 family)